MKSHRWPALLLLALAAAAAAARGASAQDMPFCAALSPCGTFDMPVGVAAKYCAGIPCGVKWKYAQRSLCTDAMQSSLDRAKGICQCSVGLAAALTQAPGLISESTSAAAYPITGLTSPILSAAATHTACLINAALQPRDVDKAQQLSNLNAQKPNSLAGVRAWTTVYFPITLADYLDFGQRLALCTSSILTRRRLQQADGGAPAGPPLPGEVPAIAAAGALAANGTGTEPPAVPLAAALEAAAPANISALPLDNPLFAALASAGGLPQNTPEAAAAAATPAARPDALALSGLPGALLAAPAAPKVLNPIVIAAACQQLVDWVGVKADFILAKLLPMAVGEIKPLLDFMVSAISWFNDIASAVDTLTSPTHWNAYLGACGSYLTKAFGDGRCDNACLTLLTPSAQTISAIGKAAMGMHASADKLLAGSRTLADWASYVRASFCKTTRIAKGTEFRKLSIWEALESAIKGRRLAVQTPKVLADVIESAGDLSEAALALAEVGSEVADCLKEAVITGKAVGAAAKKDLDNVEAYIKAQSAAMLASSTKSRQQAGAVLAEWGRLLGEQRKLRDAATKLVVDLLLTKVSRAATDLAGLYAEISAWEGGMNTYTLFGAGRLTYKREARAGFSYPKSGVSSFCASMFGKKYCVDYPKVIMAYTSVKIPLPNEHIIWVRKHAGLQKALVALNKALDPAYKLKLDPSGMC